MDLPRLITALSDPTAYPHPVGAVEVRQTHISVVFLAGPFVYKVKKPVALGFLDFSSLDRRSHYCREEVRLNRRLAPDVYLGVVPVVTTPAGVRLGGDGEPLEWAVKMRRLPDDATLLERVRRGTATVELVEAVARRLAAFHREAEGGERVAAFARFDAVAENVRNVFDRASAGTDRVIGRVRELAEAELDRRRPLVERRAAGGVPRDCHGDLHLDHIYCFPEQTPPADLTIIDCIEFGDRFRFADPVADAAFAVMDFAFHGRRDLAGAFADAYFRATADDDGRSLLPLYTAYRAAVRGMVEGLLVREGEVPEGERAAAAVRSRAHWLLALGELESPDRRPCLVLVSGLPGTGKSTLARGVGGAAGFDLIRSDVVRKELVGLVADEPSPAHLRPAVYSAASTDDTYAECLRRAEGLLAEGRRVLVDATFKEGRHRRAFLDAAVQHGVPAVVLWCQADPETIRGRLAARRGDASDADWAVYTRIAGGWEESSPEERRVTHPIDASGTADQTLVRACGVLRDLGLIPPREVGGV
jgi:aminoglycoside phosphotransferase family enzyme/predicted kinase